MLLNGQMGLDVQGNPMQLKHILLQVLAHGANDKTLNRPIARLMDRVEFNEQVELSEADLAMIRKCMDAAPLAPLPDLSLEFHLWPEQMADSDKEMAQRRFSTEK